MTVRKNPGYLARWLSFGEVFQFHDYGRKGRTHHQTLPGYLTLAGYLTPWLPCYLAIGFVAAWLAIWLLAILLAG